MERLGFQVKFQGSKISFSRKSRNHYTKTVLEIADFQLFHDAEKRGKNDLSFVLGLIWTQMKAIVHESPDFTHISFLRGLPSVHTL